MNDNNWLAVVVGVLGDSKAGPSLGLGWAVVGLWKLPAVLQSWCGRPAGERVSRAAPG